MRKVFSWLRKNDAGMTADGVAGSSCVYPIAPIAHGEPEFAALAGNALFGLCPVCGCTAHFCDFTENLRETGRCSHCGSNNRQRQMAFMIRRLYGIKVAGTLALPRDIRIYNTESQGGVHQALMENNTDYAYSEFFGSQYRSGEYVEGIMHQDLQRLSFAGGSVDLVLSSDVFEHIPDPYAAHGEIHRVLSPGGVHVFTVPFANADYLDQPRAIFGDNGEVKHLRMAIYHSSLVRPQEGVLVWNIFALEMLVKLKTIGFDTEIWLLHEPSHGIIGPLSLVFAARKGKGAP